MIKYSDLANQSAIGETSTSPQTQHTQDLSEKAARRQSHFISISRIDVWRHSRSPDLSGTKEGGSARYYRETLSLLGSLVFFMLLLGLSFLDGTY